jgi:hypothetical protein
MTIVLVIVYCALVVWARYPKQSVRKGFKFVEIPIVQLQYQPTVELVEIPIVQLEYQPTIELVEIPIVKLEYQPTIELVEMPIVQLVYRPTIELVEIPIIQLEYKEQTITDYSGLTVAKLRKIAQRYGIKGARTMRKAQLLEALTQ